MRARIWWIAGIVIAVLVTAGVFALSGQDPQLKLPGGLTDASASGTEDLRAGVVDPPAVTDAIKLPSPIARKAGDTGEASLTPEERTAYQRYLDETAAVVRDNATGLENIVAVAIDALMNDDIAGLSSVWAPDEEVDTSHIEAVAKAYPTMVSGAFQPTVKVAAVGDSTVYFAYAVVEWTDAGITSTHTIDLPVRFINGQWYLTSMGRNTKGLIRVQTVRVR